jgi:hypothetical protein
MPDQVMAASWLDAVIQSQISNGPAAIAQAIAASQPFLDAIRAGLANVQTPGTMGRSPAQVIRQEIVKVFSA